MIRSWLQRNLWDPGKQLGFIWRRTIFKPFRDKRARACVVGKKRGGVAGKREGSFNIYVPLCLEYTLAPIPLLFSFHSAPRCMPRKPKKVQHGKQHLEPLCGPWSPIRKEYFQYVEVSYRHPFGGGEGVVGLGGRGARAMDAVTEVPCVNCLKTAKNCSG